MIYGTGIDIVSMERVRKIADSHRGRFAEKILTEREKLLMEGKNVYEFLAGRFAAKEAVIKAMGNGALRFTDIEILSDENGRPYMGNPEFLKSSIEAGRNTIRVHLSISHEHDYAVASAVIEVE